MAQKDLQFDLIIIGADRAGLAAAACAARFGAKTALVKTGEEDPEGGSYPAPPNFVWRQLGLHETGLSMEPISARVSLFEDGRRVTTFESMRKTEAALIDAFPDDGGLWMEFEEMTRRLGDARRAAAIRAGAATAKSKPAGKSSADGQSFFAAFDSALDTGPRPTASAAEALDDYFKTPELKTHLAQTALGVFALGGDEPASVEALGALSRRAGWPARDGEAGPGLADVLRETSVANGASLPEARLRGVGRAEGKLYAVELEDGQVLTAKKLMASSARQARFAGLYPETPAPALAPREGTHAHVRIKLSEKASVADAPKDAVFYLAASMDELRRARDASLEGRIADDLPLSFELKDEEIFVRAPYCPQSIMSEDGERSWTQQDRQAFGKQVVARVVKHLEQPAASVRQVDVAIASIHDNIFDGTLQDGAAPTLAPDTSRVSIEAPAPSHDVIGAAAALAIAMVQDG